MADSETKTERLSIALTLSDRRALEFIQEIHPEKYESWHQVVRDYSVADAVLAHERALASVKAADDRRTGEDRRATDPAA